MINKTFIIAGLKIKIAELQAELNRLESPRIMIIPAATIAKVKRQTETIRKRKRTMRRRYGTINPHAAKKIKAAA